MKAWKQLNSSKNRFLSFTQDEIDNDSLPTTMDDGLPIPLLNFGINIDKLDVYYWNGTEWIQTQ